MNICINIPKTPIKDICGYRRERTNKQTELTNFTLPLFENGKVKRHSTFKIGSSINQYILTSAHTQRAPSYVRWFVNEKHATVAYEYFILKYTFISIKMVTELALYNPIIHSRMGSTNPSWCIGPAMLYGWCVFRNNGSTTSFKANPMQTENGAHRVVTAAAGSIGNRSAGIVYDPVAGAFCKQKIGRESCTSFRSVYCL